MLYYLILFIWHRRNPEEREVLQSVVETHHRDRSRREEIESMSIEREKERGLDMIGVEKPQELAETEQRPAVAAG